MSKKTTPTFDREMKNVPFKNAFKHNYKKLLLSELRLSIKEGDTHFAKQIVKEIRLLK